LDPKTWDPTMRRSRRPNKKFAKSWGLHGHERTSSKGGARKRIQMGIEAIDTWAKEGKKATYPIQTGPQPQSEERRHSKQVSRPEFGRLLGSSM